MMAPGEAPSMAASLAPSVAASAGSSAKPLDLGAASSGVSNLDSYRMTISATTGSDTQTLSIEETNTPVVSKHYVLGGNQTMELITIKGQGSWLKQGETWTPIPTGADAMLSVFDALAPDKLISSYALGQFGDNLSYVDTKDHNGVRAAHYHLDADLATKLGAVGFPTDGTFDAWVTVDGGYLVGMAYSGTDPSSGESSNLSIDVTDVNDPSIVIGAPVTS
jgi:hypothetical protein